MPDYRFTAPQLQKAVIDIHHCDCFCDCDECEICLDCTEEIDEALEILRRHASSPDTPQSSSPEESALVLSRKANNTTGTTASPPEAGHLNCPQLRDGEPEATGRHCPLGTWEDED